MPRIARLVVPDYPHHITQRGNYRQDIFKDDADRRQYLFFIADYSRKYRLAILAYCLMKNHIHFIVLPKDEDSLGDTFRIVHTRYAQYFNKKMRATGHLWQGRYYSCVLDEHHLVAAARYVERNPVRVKVAKTPTDYIWSSAKSHAALSHNDIIDASQLFNYIEIEQDQWKEFIDKGDEPDEVATIRKYTMTGRPLGSAAFIQKLEKRFGERLHALSIGRPKNTGAKGRSSKCHPTTPDTDRLALKGPSPITTMQVAINSGVGVARYGGESLDPYVASTYEYRQGNTGGYIIGLVNNCKQSAGSLLADAISQQYQQSNK